MAVIDTEALWFRIISVLVVGFFLGLFIANAVYFDRIVREPFSCTITRGEAQTLFWFNVIWAVIAAIFFVWAVVRLFWHATARAEAKQKVKHYVVAGAAGAKKAAGAQLERTDIGFGRTAKTGVPVVSSVRRSVPVPVTGSLASRQITPPTQTPALQQHIVGTLGSPTAVAPVVRAAAFPGVNPGQ